MSEQSERSGSSAPSVSGGSSIVAAWARLRFTEDDRFSAAFERSYGPETAYYYDRAVVIPLTCQALEAAAPEVGVWVAEAGTLVGCRQAAGYWVQQHRRNTPRERGGRFRHRRD